MTVLGKILAIVNLVLSLAVAAFIVMTFVARTNWHLQSQELDKQLKIAINNANTYQQETASARDDVKKAQKEGEDNKKVAQATEQRLNDSVARLTTSLAAEQKKAQDLDNSKNLALAELQSRQSEVAYLKTLVTQRDDQLKKVESDNQKTHNQATAMEIQRDQLKERNDRLNTELVRLTKDNQKLQQTGGTGTATAATGPKKNPPAEDVEGIVKKTDAESGYVTLSIGSDAGLSKGNTMEVYRLAPTPTYLGTVEILAVRSDQAVAKPVTRMRGTIQVGDRVSSSITVRR